jgi:hypothetical protein
MFKHVSRKNGEAGSDNSDSGSDHEDQEAVTLEEGDEFAGFGSNGEEDDEESGDDEEDDEHEGQSAFMQGQEELDGDDEQELPENLPSLQDAVTSPVFELSEDAASRKTVHSLSLLCKLESSS